jgi:transposase
VDGLAHSRPPQSNKGAVRDHVGVFALKKAILNRKNALFYKTLNGAAVGDLFMSLIHITCELNGAKPFGYLTELQKHSEELKQKPSEWMPWNYRATLARLATPHSGVVG